MFLNSSIIGTQFIISITMSSTYVIFNSTFQIIDANLIECFYLFDV